MPKEELVISKFEGGLMDYHDPRDIPDNSLAIAENVMVDKIGKIRSMGAEVVHPSIGGPVNSSDPADRYLSSNSIPGGGLYSFGADNSINKNSASYLVTMSVSAPNTTATMSGGAHNLSKGDWVYIEGCSFSGRFQITSITSTTAFVFTSSTAVGTNERFYWYRDVADFTEADLYAIQNKEKINIIDQTAMENTITLYSSDTNNVNPTFYSSNDALRVCDTNFSNANNTPKWFGYLPERTQFINHAEVLGGAFWEEHNSLNSGTLSLVTAARFDMDNGSGEQIVHSVDGADGIELQDGVTIKLTFDLTLQASHTINPVVYLTEAQDQMPTNAVSEVRLATGGAGSAQSNTIYLTPRVSSSTQGVINFYTNGDVDYLVENLTVHHVSYIPAGWYEENHALPTPTASTFKVVNDDVAIHDEDIADHNTTLQLYKVGVAQVTDPSGEFMGGTNSNHVQIRLGMSYIFYDGQESKVYENTATNIVLSADNVSINATVQSCSYSDSFDGSTFIDHRITGCRIYLVASGSTTTSLVYPDEPQLLIDVDNIKGARWWNGDWIAWAADAAPNDNVAHSVLTNLSHIPFYDYMTLNAYSNSVNSISAKYKTAVVASSNNKCYIGNVQHSVVDDQSGVTSERHFGDKIIKSPPRKHDTFPTDNIGNSSHVMLISPGDGDSIIKLMEFSNRLLVFKKRNVYIVDISDDADILESTHRDIGIYADCCAVDTPYGPVWVNKLGVHFFDGEKVVNLIDQKLDKISWLATISNEECSIGYMPYMKQLLVFSSKIGTNSIDTSWNNVIYIYDFITQSWTKGVDCVHTGSKSNAQTTPTGEMVYLANNSVGEHAFFTVTQAAEISYSYGSILITDGRAGTAASEAVYLHMYNGSAWKRISGLFPFTEWYDVDYAGYEQLRVAYANAVTDALNEINGTTDAGHLDLITRVNTVTTLTSGSWYKYSLLIEFWSNSTNGATQVVDGVTTSFAFSTVEGFDDSPDGEGNAPTGDSGSSDGLEFTSTTMAGYSAAAVQIATIDYFRGGSTDNGVTWNTTISITSAPDHSSGATARIGSVTASYTTSGGSDDNAAIATGMKSAFEAITSSEAEIVPIDWITFSVSSNQLVLTGTQSGVTFTANSQVQTQKGSVMATFNNRPTSGDTPPSSSPSIFTKDYDFGSPGVKKKVYKVYLTYKFATGSGIKPTYSINGGVAIYDFDTTSIATATNWSTVELKPASTSVTNSIYSIQLHFHADGTTPPRGFEINDVTIVYRKKNIK